MEFQIKAETVSQRCEICHQVDCYDPINDHCTRCAEVKLSQIKSELDSRPVGPVISFFVGLISWAFRGAMFGGLLSALIAALITLLSSDYSPDNDIYFSAFGAAIVAGIATAIFVWAPLGVFLRILYVAITVVIRRLNGGQSIQ
jgi:hypothetical protein